MWPLLGARGNISTPGDTKHKGAKWTTFSIYVHLCDSPRVWDDRPTRDQVHFLFVRRLSVGRRITYRGGQQENQSVYPAGYSTCLYLNLFNVDLRREET